jgi:hypothetical protein
MRERRAHDGATRSCSPSALPASVALAAALASHGCTPAPPGATSAAPAASASRVAVVAPPPQPTPEAPSAAPPPPASAAAAAPARPEPLAVVRFACDEKYVDPSCEEPVWMAEIARDPWSRNLLDHDHGGPEGAIWNGNASMFVIVRPSVRSVSIRQTKLVGTDASGLRWFRIPRATWNAALRNVPGRPYRAAPVFVDGKNAGEIWFAEGE